MYAKGCYALAGTVAILLLTGCRRDPCVLRRPPATAQFKDLSQDYDRAVAAAKANAAEWGEAMRGLHPMIVAGNCAEGAIRFIALRPHGVGGGETFYYDAKSGRFMVYVASAELSIPEDPCRGARYYPRRFKCRDLVETEVLYPCDEAPQTESPNP